MPKMAPEELDRLRGLARAAWARLHRGDLGSAEHVAATEEYERTRDDLHDAYKTHSKSLRSVLADDAVDVSHDDGINPDGTLHDGMEAYTDADITRLQQARLHTTHAIHLLEQYVAHPDHQPAT